MTQRPALLEDFDAPDTPAVTAPPEEDRQDRLAAYDEGYGAGWDDGVAATRAEIEDADAALKAHLQDLGFTFHEARAHVMRTVQPLLSQVLAHAVPRVLHQTLVDRLAEDIETLVTGEARRDITLLGPPGTADRLAPLLAGATGLPIDPQDDAELADGMLHLRLGPDCEHRIDLKALDRVLDDAFAALDDLNKERLSHG